MSFPRYPKYKPSGVEWLGDVPEHWGKSKLRYACKCLDGQRIPLNAAERSDRPGEIPYWGANSIVGYVDEALFDEDLVLLGEDGAPFFEPSKPVAFFSQGKVWPNNHVHVLRPTGAGTGKFITHVLNVADYAQFIDGSTRDKLTQGSMNDIPVPWPPLTEQTAIAEFLDRETAKIDGLVAEQRRLMELLKEKRQAVISHAVTKGLNPRAPMKPSGIKWLGAIPAHWQVVQSRRLFRVRNEPARDSDQQLTASQKYGMIFQSDFVELEGRRVVEIIKGTDSLRHADPNDFVISLRSFQGGLEWCKLAGSITFHYVVLVPVKCVHEPFFAHLFKSIAYIQALRSTTNLIRDGQDLRYSNFVQVDLPVIPLKEQAEIASYLDRELAKFDALTAEAQRAIDLLQERRTALISAAVTGQIDVRNVTDIKTA
jgi:type I restriction enzyme S subunit